MGDGQITRKDIITDEALNWGEDYKKTMEAAILKNKEFTSGILEMHNANQLLRGSIDQKTFVENQKKVNDAAQKNIVIWKEQIQLENTLIATKKKNELATESTNRELTKQRILLAEQNKAVKEESKLQLGLVTVYQKVQNKLNALGKEYSDLSIRKNLGAKLTDQEIKRYEFLEKKITTYDQALKLTDATQGKHQRNVGNYASGYNALGNSINQLTREAPAFAVSMSTGFLAISNNIPAFFDALEGIKKKNIDLANSGKPTKSMLAELGSSLFSVQTLMSVGVTLLTIYGAKMVEWAANALKSSKSIDEMALSTETLNKAFENTNVTKAMEDVNQLAINIQLAKDGFLDKNKVVNEYNETIGKTTGLVGSLDEAERELTKNGDAYIKMTLYKAAANLALEEAAKQSLEAEKSRLKSLKEFASATDDLSATPMASSSGAYEDMQQRRIDSQKRRKKEEIKISQDAADKNINIAKKFQTDAAKIAKGFNFNFFGDNKAPKETKASKKTGVTDTTFELEKQRLERTIAINNDIVKDSERTDQERLKSLENSENAQIELITKSKENQLKLAGETFNKELKEGNKTGAGLIQLRKNHEADKLKINEDASNKIIDINEKTSAEIEKINQFDSKQYQDNLNEGVKKNEIAMNEELAAENERFAKLGDLEAMAQADREKAVEDHERNIFNIKKEFALATAKLQLANLEAELKAYELQSDGSAKSQQFILEKRKQISEFSLKITELGVDNFKEGEVEKTKTAKEQTEEILQVSSDMTGALSDLSNAFSEAKIQKIDEEINKNNEYYDKQIELAGNDIRQKELLEKERDKKNELLEKKKRAAQHKQAVFDKAVTVAQIAIQTALAIITAAAATAPTFWGVAIAATLGAIELGAALATPIPKYKMGRKGGPAEFAWVGDGGVPEVVTGPGGSNPRLTPKIPTLTHLGQGDIVHKSMADYQHYMRDSILASLEVDKNRMNEFQANQIFENDNKEVVKELQLTRKAIEKNKTNITLNAPKIDIPHEIWKMKNTNWNQ